MNWGAISRIIFFAAQDRCRTGLVVAADWISAAKRYSIPVRVQNDVPFETEALLPPKTLTHARITPGTSVDGGSGADEIIDLR
ncbi:hypothetical protein [Stieleria mannarensis]|uniref:hypothetical protein n=1 Tax=Stieleria mannarensis TaxID=2755585 RepID=UPI001603A765|nr:hypothetical protein [Rhodopirellula sp. JC639]